MKIALKKWVRQRGLTVFLCFLIGGFVAAVEQLIWPDSVAAQPWCGGHYIDWRGNAPKAFFAQKHEDGIAPVLEAPAWLNRERWDALVFNAFDRAEPLGQTVVLRREDVAGMRVCVQSPEASGIGKHLEPYANREWWQFHIRRWTGVSWGGDLRIAECRGEPPNGWVYVRAAEGDEIGFGAAFARSRREPHPHGAGRWLSSAIVFQPEPSNPDALKPLAFEGILAHELGHVMGLWHVPGDFPSWIMQVPAARPWPEDESQHAQLAYQVGPNVQYPGLVEGGLMPGARVYYFPDYVDGGGWSVQLAVSNLDTTAAAAVVVTAYDQEGQPIPGFFDSEATIEIPALGTRVLRSTGMGEIRRGWIEAETDTASVSGLLTYSNAGTGLEVSVEPVEFGSHFALFVEESGGIGTGLAIFKPDPSSTIEFRIRDEDGINPLDEEFARVGDFNQAGLTIPEWFAMDGIDTEFLNDFRGLLFLRTGDGSSFAPLGIRFGRQGESLSSVPVVQVSSVPESPVQLAPADEAEFNELFVGMRLEGTVTTPPITITVDFVSAGRLSETSPLGAKMGSYTYENTGPNTGTFTSTYDDESQCTTDLTFDSTTTGTAVANCPDNVLAPVVPFEWRLIEIPSGQVTISASPPPPLSMRCEGTRCYQDDRERRVVFSGDSR